MLSSLEEEFKEQIKSHVAQPDNVVKVSFVINGFSILLILLLLFHVL